MTNVFSTLMVAIFPVKPPFVIIKYPVLVKDSKSSQPGWNAMIVMQGSPTVCTN